MRKFQSGGYLVLVSLLMVVLIGIGALALDLGRMLVVRTEAQNAVDSAALAAAAELDGISGARDRAEDVATGLLDSTSAFTRQSDLLDGLVVKFYSDLGDPPGSARIAATNDSDARFVRVVIDQASVGLLFLPVLGVVLDNVSEQAFISAAATAGRTGPSQVCGYAPVMLCLSDINELPLGSGSFTAGNQIQVPIRGGGAGSPGGPGSWSLLLPATIHPGNQNDLEYYLNNSNDQNYCVNPQSATFQKVPGAAPNLVDAFNDFFGVDEEYDESSPTSAAYPRDSVATDEDNRGEILLGSGDWSPSDYTGVNGTPQDQNELDFPTRLEAYEDRFGDAGNRIFTIPVMLNCDAWGPNESRTMENPEGFAQFFLTEPISSSGNSGNSGNSNNSGGSANQPPQIMAEFIGWGAGGNGGSGTSGGAVLYE